MLVLLELHFLLLTEWQVVQGHPLNTNRTNDNEDIMKPIDLITVLLLIPVIPLAVVVHILIRQGKFKPKAWPRALGIGGGVYMFVSSMATSILLRPTSEFVDYTITNLFWSLAMGIVLYFTAGMLARRRENKK